MSGTPHYRFRSLGDALAQVQAWSRRESGGASQQLRDSCRFLTFEGGDVVLHVQGETTARALQLGELGVEPPEGRWRGEELDLAGIFARARLVVRSVEPGDRILALPRSKESFRILVGRLADVRAAGQRVLRVRSDEGDFDGMEFEAPPLELLASELGLEDSELFVLSGEEDRHALPVGWSHPLLTSFPDLVPSGFGASPEGAGALKVWRWGADPSIGQWKAYTVDRGWSRPAERVELGVLEGDVVPIGGGALGSLDLEIRSRRSASEGLSEGQRAIVEVEDLSGSVTVERLLDVLDDLELGRYSADTRMWVHRTGRSRASRARYFVEVDAAAGAAVSHVRGLRVYLQSASMRERGIPLYVDSRCRLHPDPDALLPELEQGHPFVGRLKEAFPTDGSAEVHLLREGTRARDGRAVLESLSGSRIVRDLMGVLRARPLGELAGEAVDDLTERLSERSKEQFEALAALARQETAHLDREFEDIAAAFREQLSVLDERLRAAHEKLESAKELFGSVEGLIESVPRTWDQVRVEIANLDESVVRGRVSWMAEVQSDVVEEQQALIRQARELEDAVEATRPLLEEIETQRGQVETGFRRLEEAMSRVQAARSKILGLGAETQEKFDEASRQLEEARRILSQVEAREAARQSELERAVEEWQVEEQRLRGWNERLDRDQRELDRRKGEVEARLAAARIREEKLREERTDLEASERELEELTTTLLPELQADLNQRRASFDPEALSSARRQREAIERSISHHQASRKDLDELEQEVLPRLRQQLADLERSAPDVADRRQRLEAKAARLMEPKTRLGRILFRTGRWFG